MIRKAIADQIRSYENDYKKTSRQEREDRLTPKRYALILISCELAQNTTAIEQSVEDVLLKMDLYARNQFPVDESYVADFLLKDGATIVECDGREYHKEKNHQRDKDLVAMGYRVLHLPGYLCLNEKRVWEEVEHFVEDKELSIQYSK